MKPVDEYARLAEGCIELAKKSSVAKSRAHLISVGQIYATLTVAAAVREKRDE
jgi:hypothetical protein